MSFDGRENTLKICLLLMCHKRASNSNSETRHYNCARPHVLRSAPAYPAALCDQMEISGQPLLTLLHPDSARPLAKQGRQACRGRLFGHVSLGDGEFDAVITLFFIDISENIIGFLSNIHRLLKPGGVWINLGRT